VTMYYHFAFMAISIALFGLSASGVYVFLMRERWRNVPTGRLLAAHAFAYTVATVLALAILVRLHVGLNYAPVNIALMSAVYLLSALPFFAGGATISLAISRLSASVNAVYAADLLGAGAGCLLLMPALNLLGAPGAIAASAILGVFAGLCLGGTRHRLRDDRRLRGQHDEGSREPSGSLQQVEFVLADRRVRPALRRMVAQ
jgi:hypothetical protein